MFFFSKGQGNERKGQGIEEGPFQPEYSSLSYSVHLEQLCVCVNHNLLQTDVPLKRDERLWINLWVEQ